MKKRMIIIAMPTKQRKTDGIRREEEEGLVDDLVVKLMNH